MKKNLPPAIKVENLSKRYVIRSSQHRKASLSLAEMITQWGRRLGNSLASFGSFDKQLTDEDEEFFALSDVNFEIHPGEVVGVIGQNGAGKSTLLKILSRITEPTKGRIELNGRVASLLEVGTGFHPELSGRENIFLNGAILGMSRVEIQRKFDEIVAFSDVEKFLDVPVKRYSSGMFVRLAFSVAAHLDPEILIVDEVLAVGDLAFQKKCMGKMNEVASESGRTILFVSHNMASIQRLCHKAMFLKDGKLVYFGEVQEAVQQYLASGQDHALQGIELSKRERKQIRKITDVSFESCILMNGDGVEKTLFNFGESLSIKIEMIAGESLDDFSVELSLDTLSHVRVATLQSTDQGVTFSIQPNQRLVINISFEHFWLKPGIYHVNLLASRMKGPVDRLIQAASFEVTHIPIQGVSVPNEKPGLIQPETTWKLSEELVDELPQANIQSADL